VLERAAIVLMVMVITGVSPAVNVPLLSKSA